MNTKLFGQFLLEKGYISREQLLEALGEQKKYTHTLGDLAVATGMLTPPDVEAIHRVQHERNQPFSAAAVALGLLTEQQLASLVHPNSVERLLLGQILLVFGHLDQATLDEALKAHAREPETDGVSVMSNFRGSDLDDVAPTCISVMASVFKETVGAPVTYTPIPASKGVSVGQSVWSQAVDVGSERFLIAVQLSDAETFVIAEAVLGMTVDGFLDLARDAVGEFVNLVTGHVCGNLRAAQGSVSAEPPLRQSPEEFAEAAQAGVAVQCTSDAVEFTYLVARPLKPVTKPATWSAVGAAGIPERARVGRLA